MKMDTPSATVINNEEAMGKKKSLAVVEKKNIMERATANPKIPTGPAGQRFFEKDFSRRSFPAQAPTVNRVR